MASISESSLLTKLESSNSIPIYSLFSDYLHPFTDVKGDQTLIRSLTKKFLSFINKSLTILPKRLANSRTEDQQLTTELFDIYKLCLNCLDLVSSQLVCKPYSIQLQRVRLVRCLEAHRKYEDAEAEGVRVLERLRSMDFEGKSCDAEFAIVFVDVVAAMVKCAAIGQRKDAEVYRRVLGLLEEARYWFRVLDANEYEKLHRVLVAYLGKCTLFLAGELLSFNADLVREFCVATLTEYAKSSMKDQIYKFSRRICSSLFSLQESKPSLIEIIVCVLNSIARQCKVEMDNNGVEFVELVSYCANKCRTAGTIVCGTFAGHLNHISRDFPQLKSPIGLILRLYAVGLSDVKYGGRDSTSSGGVKDESRIRILLGDEDRLQNLATLLGLLGSYFYLSCKENCVPSSIEYEGSFSRLSLLSDSSHGASIASTPENRETYMLSYLNGLKFLCQPLAELVNLEKKGIVAEIKAAPVHPQLCSIQEAFYQFCVVFISFHSCTSERERDGLDDIKTVLTVAVAAFILSITTNIKTKKIARLIKHIIASKWIQPQGLKYLFGSLYNIGVHLFRNNQVKEASKALKLCCVASWTCVTLLCEMFVHKSDGSHDDLSEGALVDFVNEACTRSAFLLDVLYHRGSQKLEKLIVESLENWSIAGNLLRVLPNPMSLVKQWVKIECKRCKNLAVEDGVPTLYSLLSFSAKVSGKTMGIISEQELRAYEEMKPLGPEFCQRMQMKIISVLLQDVYITQDSCLQKSRLLLRKGRALRARGTEGLKDCIQCLSEAISIMNDMPGETCGHETPPCHQLAVAYCLRALCTQEAEPNSKQVIEDIDAALNLWLSISIPIHCSANDECNMVSENTMLLLYNIIDLLSMKGCMEYHYDIYKLMIKLLKLKNVPSEKCLAILWESRRLSHALCVSPVNEAFITNLAEHHGELSKSIDFWIHCLQGSQPLLVGFQQSFFFLFANIPHANYTGESSSRLYITIDDVKKAASELISSAPLPSRSAFLVGHLYYDLCERLISNGQLLEALSYAKEAHRLRTGLFQKKFSYSLEEQVEKYNDAGETVQRRTYGHKSFQVVRSVASEFWSFDATSWNMDGCYLSPWNVLQCYLESTLQVAVIHELVGNGVEAETFLLWGKSISSSQSLPLFIVAFSSVLGKLYRKKGLWDLAKKELRSAEQILVERSTTFSCLKCRLMLEATVDQQLGDLSRTPFDSAKENISLESFSHADKLYKSALDKLNLSEWKNLISCPEEASSGSTLLRKNSVQNVEYGATDTSACSVLNQPDKMGIVTENGLNAKMEGKKGRKAKNAPSSSLKEQYLIPEQNTRITRSKYRSSLNQCVDGSIVLQAGLSKHTKGNIIPEFSDNLNQRESVLEIKRCTVDTGCEATCFCNKMKCWQCLPLEVIESGLLENFLHVKWEFVRRRMSLRLLTGIGKCLGNHDPIHEKHKIILQSISALISRNPFCHTNSSLPPTLLLDLIGKEFSGDVFAVERAAILYNMCWFFLKGYHSTEIRNICCDLSHIQLQQIVSWLRLAFVLCREVPVLFQKVSRLLAVLYILSASSKSFPPLSSCKALSESQWASFFHQASLGTHLNYQFLSNMSWRSKAQHLLDAEGSHVAGLSYIGTKTCNLLRVAPESTKDLEQFVKDFFVGLPCTTIVCVNLLGGAYASLLQELLFYPAHVHAWMLLSRLDSKGQPIVILLPVNTILEEVSDDDDANFGNGVLYESKDCDKHWHCPWGSTVVDDVAPAFKLILEESYLSSSFSPTENTKEIRSLWWTERKKLDHRLGKLLRNLEDSWLGPWKCMILGEWSNCKPLDLALKKLVRDLKSKCKMDVNETLLRAILGGSEGSFKGEECIPQLCFKKGCYIDTIGYYGKDMFRTSSEISNGVEKLSELALQLIREAWNELQEDNSVNREPTILVMDCEIQMLPWENIPILRNQEVYRMPSVGSISVMLERIHHHQEQAGRLVAAFPLVDPLDAFYLLNPSGDLSSTQAQFEDWFRDQNLEGKAGSAPTAEELAVALKNHDLFIYFGHGSGAQYISRNDIMKLENCAATFLMGCSSGSLSLNGCYIPQGTPLCYLLAGSPVIFANLWDVTDKDIDRFGKAMLDAWLRERSNLSEGCDQCTTVVEEFEANSAKGCRVKKKKVSRKKLPETLDTDCDHRPRLGSFMGQAREACILPFLIGASPVCYGVPTGIKRKTGL